jgi:hypothetical protein
VHALDLRTTLVKIAVKVSQSCSPLDAEVARRREASTQAPASDAPTSSGPLAPCGGVPGRCLPSGGGVTGAGPCWRTCPSSRRRGLRTCVRRWKPSWMRCSGRSTHAILKQSERLRGGQGACWTAPRKHFHCPRRAHERREEREPTVTIPAVEHQKLQADTLSPLRVRRASRALGQGAADEARPRSRVPGGAHRDPADAVARLGRVGGVENGEGRGTGQTYPAAPGYSSRGCASAAVVTASIYRGFAAGSPTAPRDTPRYPS